MKRFNTAVFLLILSGNGVAHGVKDEMKDGVVEKKQLIAAGKHYESCFFLNRDQQLIYDFQATEQLEFNVHYHYKKKLYYPVFPEKTAALEGKLVIRDKEKYCLMWANTNKRDITVAYVIKIE